MLVLPNPTNGPLLIKETDLAEVGGGLSELGRPARYRWRLCFP